MFLGTGEQRVLQRAQRRLGLVGRVAHPEAEIGRHLVVARAGGVEAPGHRPDLRRQPRFGEHVDVLERQVLGHALGLEIGRDLAQAGMDRRGVLRRDDALRAQHRHMRLAAAQVLAPHPLVEGNRGVYLAHHRGRAFGEAPAPHGIGAVLALGDLTSPSGHAGDRGVR